MAYRIFVDGQEGTTGLQINEYLARRSDVELLRIDPGKRKDSEDRARLLNAADVAFLCLPDAAALVQHRLDHRRALGAAGCFAHDHRGHRPR